MLEVVEVYEEISLSEIDKRLSELQQQAQRTTHERKMAEENKKEKETILYNAEQAVRVAERKYDGLAAALTLMQSTEGVLQKAIDEQAKAVKEAEDELNNVKKALDAANKSLHDASDKFNDILVLSQKEKKEIDKILVSCGMNEDFNRVAKDELTFEYDKKIAEKKDNINGINEKIIDISNDDAVIQKIKSLKDAYQAYQTFAKGTFSSTISSKEQELREQYGTKIVDLQKFLKDTYGIIMSDQDIEAMIYTDLNKTQGNYIIQPLENDKVTEQEESRLIEQEKRAILEKLESIKALTAKDPTEYDKKIAEAEADLAETAKAIMNKETAIQDIEKQSANAEKERTLLEKELAEAEKGTDNTQIIKVRQKRLEEIEAALKLLSVEDPKRVKIQKEIDKIDEMINTAVDGQVENPEYVNMYDEAYNAWDQAYKNYFTALENAARDLGYNYDEWWEEYSQLDAEIKELQGQVDEEISIKYDAMMKAEKELEQAEKDYEDKRDEKEADILEKLKEKGYISEKLYPELTVAESHASQIFRDAELEVRKAVMEAQMHPTGQNIEKIKIAMNVYQEKSKEFAEALNQDALESPAPITMEDCHNYLLSVLDREEEAGMSLDPAYNTYAVKNRFAVLEALYPKLTKKYGYDDVKSKIDLMNRDINKYFDGNESVDFQKIERSLKQYQKGIHALESNKSLKLNKGDIAKVLYGKEMPVVSKGNFFTRLFKKRVEFPEAIVSMNFHPHYSQNNPKREYLAELEKIDHNPEILGLAQEIENKRSNYEEATQEYNDRSSNESRLTELESEKAALEEEIEKAVEPKLDKKTRDKFIDAIEVAAEKCNTIRETVPEFIPVSDYLEKKRKQWEKQRDALPNSINPKKKKQYEEEKTKIMQEIEGLKKGKKDQTKIDEIKQKIAKLENLPEELVKAKAELSNLKDRQTEQKKALTSFRALKTKLGDYWKNVIKIKDGAKVGYVPDPSGRGAMEAFKEGLKEEER